MDYEDTSAIPEITRCLIFLENRNLRSQEGLEEEISNRILQFLQEDQDPAALCSAIIALETRFFLSKRPLLHWLCRFNLSLSLMQSIHRLRPTACRTILSEDYGDMLPLHEALCAGKNAEAVTFLLRCYPESARFNMRSHATGCKQIFSSFPLQQSLPIVKEFFSPDEIRDSTRNLNPEWEDPLPLDLIEFVGKTHAQNSLVICGKSTHGSGFSYSVEEGLGIVVKVDLTNRLRQSK